jgi:DNA mismatch repair protein MutS2
VELTKDISLLDAIVDKYGEIKDNASWLIEYPQGHQLVRGKVNQSFISMTQYNSLGYLDDIKESFVQNETF